MARRKEPIYLRKLKIIDAGAKGIGIGRTEEGRVVLVRGGIPGDVVDALQTRKKRNYLEARVTKVLTPSPFRREPVCVHFGLCGGCKWQNMDYTAQLRYKQQEVENNLSRIGGIEPLEIRPILPSEKEYHYRNKMEYSFSCQRWLYEDELKNDQPVAHRNALGFHVPGKWDKIIDLKECHLAEEPTENIRRFVREFADVSGISFFHPREHTGVLRTLMIRTSSEGEVMVLLQTFDPAPEFVRELAKEAVRRFPAVVSFLHTRNTKANDTLYDQEIECLEGRDYILHSMEDLRFKLRAKSFFQTNTRQAFRLYEQVRELAGLTGNEIVYDLYTGTGTIALFLAARTRRIVGIESVPDAIRDARENAEANGISNAIFEVGDMKEVFTRDFVRKYGEPDLVVTDPPRDGMHPRVVAQLLQMAPRRIVYVSCNSATQARDLQILKEKYHCEIVQAVDMFPQTHHVENIVLLQRYA